MSADRLPPILRRAFDRMREVDLKPVPAWPRCVRLGVDYAVRVGIADINNDEIADTIAWLCYVLGRLHQQDPDGDPPASCAAFDRAEEAGILYSRAFAILNTIRDASARLITQGMAVRALPVAAMKLLQRAARGEPVPDQVLREVLDAAQELAGQLAGLGLARRPGDA